LGVQCIQLEIDVAELPLTSETIFGKLHVDVGVTQESRQNGFHSRRCSGCMFIFHRDGRLRSAGNKIALFAARWRGPGTEATATLTGMSGSFLCGMEW